MKERLETIQRMINKYEEETFEKPGVLLIRPEVYNDITKYLGDIKSPIEKINTLFGVPVEVADYITHKVVCLSEESYKTLKGV